MQIQSNQNYSQPNFKANVFVAQELKTPFNIARAREIAGGIKGRNVPVYEQKVGKGFETVFIDLTNHLGKLYESVQEDILRALSKGLPEAKIKQLQKQRTELVEIIKEDPNTVCFN